MISKIISPTEDQKFQMMEFVYKNTNSFIMNTFGYLWAERMWWKDFPVYTYNVGNEIIGLHACVYNTGRYSDKLKTYYIVSSKAFRGQGIAKKLIAFSLQDNIKVVKSYYVNTEENSDGVNFYKKLFNDKYKLEKNQFGTLDYVFDIPINDALTNLNK